jgi:cyclopropane-fatty-acyl-phospholipid synthase
VTQLTSSLTAGSQGTLTVDTIDNIGGHYAKTLRMWQESFSANFDSAIAPALIKEHPEMTMKDTEIFRRKWEYYFSYCEAGFATKTLGDVIFSVSREGAMEVLEDIPL